MLNLLSDKFMELVFACTGNSQFRVLDHEDKVEVDFEMCFHWHTTDLKLRGAIVE